MKKFNLKREKRKLWLRQHKWQIIKSTSLVLCGFILCLSIMFFSRANFSTRVTFDIIDARVAPFSSGDVVLTYNIDGVDSNTIMENDGTYYKLSNYTCDNEEIIIWDNNTWSVNISNMSSKVKCKLYFETSLVNRVSLGDYINLTPSYSGSYSCSTTGCSGSITPSELTLWRVIAKNNDATVDVVSEYVSSTNITFSGESGYKYFVTALNTLASKYENSTYTCGSRMMGYNGQTGTISGNVTTSVGPFSTPYLSGDGQEYQNGLQGDTLYAKDYNAVKNTLGTIVANNVNDKSTAKDYWLASRSFWYASGNSWPYHWAGRVISSSGYLSDITLYKYYSGGYLSDSGSVTLRPILTLKSDLVPTSGDGSSEQNAWSFE